MSEGIMLTYHEEPPSAEEYNELRETVGWGSIDKKTVEKSLPNSVYAVTAKFNHKTVGFARIVGDGELCYYIQEIIVHPDHQEKGRARTFMNYIMAYFEKNAISRSYIGVFVGKGLEPFYRSYGFWERPTKMMGPGMMRFWKDEEHNRRCGK